MQVLILDMQFLDVEALVCHNRAWRVTKHGMPIKEF